MGEKTDIPFIFQTDNALRMVEALKYFKIYEQAFSRLIESVERNIHEVTEPRVLEKYEWIRHNYHYLFCDMDKK